MANLEKILGFIVAFFALFFAGGFIGLLILPKTSGIFYIAGIAAGIFGIFLDYLLLSIKHH